MTENKRYPISACMSVVEEGEPGDIMIYDLGMRVLHLKAEEVRALRSAFKAMDAATKSAARDP
jgi:hypothetical protein